MGFSNIKTSNLLSVSNFAGIRAVLAFFLTTSNFAYSQTPDVNGAINGAPEVYKEDSKFQEEKEQKQLELMAKGDVEFSSINGSNFAYLKETNFGVINKLYNPRFASTLKKENLTRLVSPMPILVDEDLNPLYAPTEYQSLRDERIATIRKTNTYFDLLGQYIYIPELKGGVFSVRKEQIISSKVSDNTSVIYFEADPSYESWMKLQIEMGNYCIMDKSGVPSIKNLPEVTGADLNNKVLTDMREKAYISLVKRWYFFYTMNAKASLQQVLPDWDKLANAHDAYTAFSNLQTPKTKK